MSKQNIALAPEEKTRWYEQYTQGIHRMGRCWLVVCLAALVGLPFLMGLVLHAMPDMNTFWRGFLNVGIIYYPVSVVEYLIYVPMLGSGASYLSFITGNLSNLKIPCAVNARDLAHTKVGTPENEVVSTLSVATSSLVTVLVLAVGVLLLVPLQPVLESPVLTPAFNNVVPALFGALGLKYFLKGKKSRGDSAGAVQLGMYFCAQYDSADQRAADYHWRFDHCSSVAVLQERSITRMIALYILLGILGLVIVLLAVCFIRATMLKPTSAKTAKPPEPDMKRAAAYAKKLSAMVRQETVSSRFDPDRTKFQKFQQSLPELFPHVFASCEVAHPGAGLVLHQKAEHPNGKEPILLMSHHDVVAAPAEGWEHDPVSR